MAFVWMSVSALLFAMMSFFARLSSAHAPWTLVAATRAFVGALVAVLVARMRGVPALPRQSGTVWLRTGFGTLSVLFSFYATTAPDLPLGDSATLLSLAPVFTALLAPYVLRERSGRRMAIALPLCVAGVLLVLRPPFLFGGAAAHPGMAVPAVSAILGALTSACAMMMLRRASSREHPEAIALHFSSAAALVCLLLSLPGLTMPSQRDAAMMLAAGVCGGVAQLTMTRAYALEQAARVAAFAYLGVVASVFLGAVGLDETPSPFAVAGSALVVGGGVVITIAGARERARARLSSAPGSTR
jgi:drug/metabolite transporter (DMT)-like permease